MEKKEVFKKEISYIKNEDIKESLKTMIDLLPDYYFEVPASSTGKYHPKFAASANGLVKHTKVAVRIAYELLSNNTLNNFTEREKDLIIMALVLHDGLKHGLDNSKYTVANHPVVIANYIKENKNKLSLSDSEIDLLCKGISSHMGPWNKDYDGNVILPVPKSAMERFIHMCDYLSSKKFLDVEFEDLDIKY